jgi:DNA-binding NtrC family response regulator
MGQGSELGQGVLVVDDDAAVAKVLVGLLQQASIPARHVSSGEEALALFKATPFDAVLTDLQMPGMSGLDLLRELKAQTPEVPVVMLTAHGSVALAVEAMKAGAADFIAKPFDRAEVLYAVRKALTLIEHSANQPPRIAQAGSMFVGSSSAMRSVSELIARAAKTVANVLVRGESGSGKEVAARTIHQLGARKDGPFVAVNCAALPEHLLESELFGYERGAFTGAGARKPGRVELAAGGTLFLDEIGDVPMSVQPKLLRLLQEKEYQRLGGTRTERADVRFIAATHRDLEALIEKGEFREDLYYRLGVIPIWMPPLRESADDIMGLAEKFADTMTRENGRSPLRFSEGARRALREHGWPGNVRELMCVVERLAVFTDADVVEEADVVREIDRQRGPGRPSSAGAHPDRRPAARSSGDDAPSGAALESTPPSEEGSLSSRRAEAERSAVIDALQRAGQNRTLAARLLGISRRTLYNRLASFGMIDG